ncbi:MAG: hypothetical protein K2K84_10390 [Muribaculaceae bacterium]|nr:hypothetical protein [Muribaculaceae bacterium]
MSETTRIMGIPISEKTDWKRILKYFAFSVMIIGMVGFGFYYLTLNQDDIRSDKPSIPTNNLPVSDVPGAEAEPIVDDAPGVVTLSDKNFALIVHQAANH